MLAGHESGVWLGPALPNVVVVGEPTADEDVEVGMVPFS